MRIWGWLGALAIALALASFASAQSPDRRGEVVTRVPEYAGERASAPIPPQFHTRNVNPGHPGWGGCVPSSLRTNALYQGVPREDVDRFWELAKRRVGVTGTGPDLLIDLVRQGMPRERYLSSLEDNPAVLDHLSRAGYPIGSTMGWGQGYNGRISHMISLVHFRQGGRACVVDSNFPGEYHWMPAAEYTARWRANGHWAFILTRLPQWAAAVVKAGLLVGAVLLALSGVVAVVVSIVVAVGRAPEPAHLLPRPAFA